MHKDESTIIARPLATLSFGEAAVSFIEYRGKPVVAAREVAERLGYADPYDLARAVLGQWKDDFLEGTDFVRLVGADLEAVKAIDSGPNQPAVVEPNARYAVLLTESGAQLAAMLSRTEKGREFRRWVVDVAIPALRERAAPMDPKAAILAAVEPEDKRWLAVLTAEDGRDRHALWRAATELRKAEIRAADAAYAVEQERRRTELLEHRRLTAETNQAERGRLVGKLVAAMRDEIEDRRAGKRNVRSVEDLLGKTSAVIADDRYGQGTAPVLIRRVLN